MQVITKVAAPADVNKSLPIQFVIFKPLSYCFEETIGLDV